MSSTVRVNPIRCRAHGLCAEILPERVTLDDWGYPIVDGEPVDGELLAHAKRAVAACPVFALALVAPREGARATAPPRQRVR
jgi:ferredoxin